MGCDLPILDSGVEMFMAILIQQLGLRGKKQAVKTGGKLTRLCLQAWQAPSQLGRFPRVLQLTSTRLAPPRQGNTRTLNGFLNSLFSMGVACWTDKNRMSF
jgi:hypothetical protein